MLDYSVTYLHYFEQAFLELGIGLLMAVQCQSQWVLQTDAKGVRICQMHLEEPLSFTAHLTPRFIVSKCKLITIHPADKGGVVVVLNTEYYHLKMLEHLNSPTHRVGLFQERGYASNFIQEAIQRVNITSCSDLLSNTQKTKNQSGLVFLLNIITVPHKSKPH